MKPYSLFLAGIMLLLASCSEEINNTATGSTIEPGTYIVGINLNMEVPLTKKINYGNNGEFSFDNEYSYDTIYLHCGEESIKIPVYDKANCPDGCKGFTYKICTDEQKTTLTPIDKNGNVSGEQSLEIKDNQPIYFSSSSEDVWQATLNTTESVPHDPSAKLYKRTEKNNAELFRSTDNFTIEDLQRGGQLNLKRICCGVTFFCTFTDRTDNELTRPKFKEVMGDYPENYKIKIYIGGSGFTDVYNISNQEGEENNFDVYYASGNSFEEDEYGNTNAVPLREGISEDEHSRLGYGYATMEKNELITPVLEDRTVKAYIYITHGDLTVYTEIEATALTEGYFYRIGADIDINELAAAFKAYEGEPADTRSTSAPRLFTPKSLVTHIEY